ncbi:MAG: BLUF domain-containing protein [Gammaproteobacteria bacterium]|nr:BLUF domain-containing protein [Gammaproteobacteria bacterium]
MARRELVALLRQARRNNARHDVTGMLLYKDKSFFSVLEGECDPVHAIFARIARDRRHEKVKTLYEGPVRERDFVDWTMGFSNPDGGNLSDEAGFTNFMDAPDVARSFFDDLTTAKKLLLLFRSRS